MSPEDTQKGSRQRRGLRIGVGLLAILVLALPIMLVKFHNDTVNILNTLSDNVSTANNVVLAEQESLQFASSFDRWLGGISTLSSLQIRRSELAEKLEAQDNSGTPTSEQVRPEYLARAADAIVSIAET